LKLIYCCGDSHTAGGELVDDLLWPDHHPGFCSQDTIDLRDMRVIEQWRRHRHKSLRQGQPVTWTEWQAQEHAHAWPQLLGEILHVPVINSARIGSSTEWIARQVMCDVSRLIMDRDPGELLVLVQPSTSYRLQVHDPAQGGWTSMQLADAHGMDAHVHSWFVERETDASLATRWLISMLGMSSWLNAAGVRWQLVDSGEHTVDTATLHHRDCSSLASAYQDITANAWLGITMPQAASLVQLCRCPDLHWTREVHEHFARNLADALCA